MATINVELTISDENVERVKEGLGYTEGSINDFLKQKIVGSLSEEIEHYYRAKRKTVADVIAPLDVDIVS